MSKASVLCILQLARCNFYEWILFVFWVDKGCNWYNILVLERSPAQKSCMIYTIAMFPVLYTNPYKYTRTHKKCIDCSTCSLEAAPGRASLFSFRNASCLPFSVTCDVQTMILKRQIEQRPDASYKLLQPNNIRCPPYSFNNKYHLGPNLDSYDQTTCWCPLPSPIYSTRWSGVFSEYTYLYWYYVSLCQKLWLVHWAPTYQIRHGVKN